MGHLLTAKSRWTMLRSHLLLLAVLVGCAMVLLHWSSLTRAIGVLAGASVALAIATHVGVALAGGGILFAAVRSHGRGRHNHGDGPGATLHSPRFYDWLAAAYCLGREGKMRERTLDVAGVAAGERVLDVCCGTGTLALAAQEKVGATGSVHGIDASPEMIARAKNKAARRGQPIAFDIGAAQSLPFADAMFDVVCCSLALHHLTEHDRSRAIDEMRRVVRPGGRVLIVEFAQARRVSALLHPVALLHRRKAQILDGVVTLMKDAGFERVAVAPLGFVGLGYALAHRH